MKYAILLFWIYLSALYAGAVKNYSATFACFENDDGIELARIRTFLESNRSMCLAVDTDGLTTHILPSPEKSRVHRCRDSRYTELLKTSSSPPYPLQNDGITGGKNGIYLTTDLCPSSKKGYESRLYTYLSQKLPKPVPVTIFITKRWIEKHPDSMKELEQMDADNHISITWGNHTAYHHYHPGVPLRHNFVLSEEENLTKDILDLEKTLIERGDTPSVFFRFPGLVSDRKSIETVSHLGLITVGSNCWLAKGESVKNGSIILVHGNGNETAGVDMLMKLIKEGMIKQFKPIQKIEPDANSTREGS